MQRRQEGGLSTWYRSVRGHTYFSRIAHHLATVKYLPTWFPGTEFKRLGALYRATATSAFEMPYHAIKQQMVCLPDSISG
jgi:hypothetical protein